MSNWLLDLFGNDDKIEKTASQDVTAERKISAGGWAEDILKYAEDDEVDLIMAFEGGELDDEGILRLFSLLVKNGHAWTLQGSYGRTAKALIEAGYLDEEGNILKDIEASKIDALAKTAAYEKGDTCEETVEKDYKLAVEGMSDLNLAEMLTNLILEKENLATDPLHAKEELEKQIKAVESSRKSAETKLLKEIGEHTLIDWKEKFKAFKEAEIKHPEAEDTNKPEFKPGKQNWEKKEEFDALSEKEQLKNMDGIGKEEEKGQVGKTAAKMVMREKVSCPKCGDSGRLFVDEKSGVCDMCLKEEEKGEKKEAYKGKTDPNWLGDLIEEQKRLPEALPPQHKKPMTTEEKQSTLRCPQCGKSESVTPAHDNKLNKCDSCGLAFDSESSPDYVEPEEKESSKTEFVKCPNCDSMTARKVGDEITCVTCGYGKKDKESSMTHEAKMSAEEIAETFINGNISDARKAIGRNLALYEEVLQHLEQVAPKEVESFRRLMTRRASANSTKEAAGKMSIWVVSKDGQPIDEFFSQFDAKWFLYNQGFKSVNEAKKEGWDVKLVKDVDGSDLEKLVDPNYVQEVRESVEPQPASQKSAIVKEAHKIGDKLYYKGHPCEITDISINHLSGEAQVAIMCDGETLYLVGKDVKQLGNEALMPDLEHKEEKPVEEPEISMATPKEEKPMEEPIVGKKATLLSKVEKIAASFQRGEAYVKRFIDWMDIEGDDKVREIMKSEISEDEKWEQVVARAKEIIQKQPEEEIVIKQVDWDAPEIDNRDVSKAIDQVQDSIEIDKEMDAKEKARKGQASEILPKLTKEATLAKIAEIESPWKIIKDDKGNDVIARVAPMSNTKKSKEEDDINELKK